MADETLTTQADPQVADSQGGLSDGQESTQAQGSTTPADSGVEKRFKDTQAAYTRSQQELQETRRSLDELKSRYETDSTEYKTVKERFDKLAAALQGDKEVQSEYTPEQIEAANRMISSTPAYKELSQRTQEFAQQTAAERSRTQREAIAVAAEQITKARNLDADGQKALRAHIEGDPDFLAAINRARTPQEALRAFDKAYRDLYFDKLERNAVAEGTKVVEQKLDQMERASAIEQPSPATGTTESIPYTGDFKDYAHRAALDAAAKLGL
jgi:chromosome segregation ATPase